MGCSLNVGSLLNKRRKRLVQRLVFRESIYATVTGMIIQKLSWLESDTSY